MSDAAKKTKQAPEAEPTTVTPNEWQAEVLNQRATAVNQAQQAFDSAVARVCAENGLPANTAMGWDGKILTERKPRIG